VEVIPFRFPLADRSRDAVSAALEDLAERLGTTCEAAEIVGRDLAPLRAALDRLDRLTWEEGRVSGGENHRRLVSASDLGGGDPDAFLAELEAAIEAAARREASSAGPRIGLFGVPPALSDLHEALEAVGARVVFNEAAFDFAMIPPASGSRADLAEQYRRYAYPYGIAVRAERALVEADRRGLDAWLVYDQSFCHHNLEAPALDRVLGDRPRLHLEGDAPGPVSGRDRIRIEAFVRTLSRSGGALRSSPSGSGSPALGLDLGSRFAKVVFRDGEGAEEARVLDSMRFYRTWARRTATGLALDLPAVLKDELGVRPPAGLTGVATGYGRHLDGLVGCRAVPEVHAHAAGAAVQAGPGELVLADLGGQDTKAVRVRDGVVLDFVMNDRCAAGSGRYVENMARLLELDLDEILTLSDADPVTLSNVCATFGESEVVGLIVEGIPVERIAAGILRSVAMRLLQLLGRLPDVSGLPLHLSGGLAASPGLVRFLDEAWDGPVAALPRPRLNGALGCLELAASGPTP